MNTKKAHGARAPLGRCLKSTMSHPDVRMRKKKTLTLHNSDGRQRKSWKINVLHKIMPIIVLTSLKSFLYKNDARFDFLFNVMDVPKKKTLDNLHRKVSFSSAFSDQLRSTESEITRSLLFFSPRRYGHGLTWGDIRMCVRAKYN